MWPRACKSFLTVAIFASCAFASNHHELNGTWQLVPTRSEFHGEPAIQSGMVTINDREGNVYVSRDFNFDGANQSGSTSFSTDAREKTSIKEPGFKSKAKWEGDMLKVTTTREGVTTVERYSLRAEGGMMLQIDRPGHSAETLFFQRQ
jgi:hypothetical protein